MRDTVQNNAINQLNLYISEIERAFSSDALTIYGPILYGLEHDVNFAIRMFEQRKNKITIILDTMGGVVEVVERMVDVIRNNYNQVDFVIPDKAMSSGTVLAMSGDNIFMSDYSCLGPIDPQIEKDGRLVPALSYLNQYKRLNEKANSGEFNNADAVLLNTLDVGELYQFEQANELSKDLLIKWLPSYLFKNIKDESGSDLTKEEKETKATKVAEVLSDPDTWHSHARMISRETLISNPDLMLDIKRIEDKPHRLEVLEKYISLVSNFLSIYDPDAQIPARVHTKLFY